MRAQRSVVFGLLLGAADRKKREEMLQQIQRVLYERRIFAPVWENGFIRGVGPRVEEAVLTLVPSDPYSAPYEEMRLKP